jgi:hypothetical protein
VRLSRVSGAVALVICVLGLGTMPPDVSAAAAPSSSSAPVSCGATRVHADHELPAWTADANPPAGVPYAVSRSGNVTAILFGDPLRSGTHTDRANKILWIMRSPRADQPLHLSAHPLHARAPLLRSQVPAGSSPGEIYPSILDVPRRGCWHVTLEWNGHHATIDLRYR